jgi:hypothetical protein
VPGRRDAVLALILAGLAGCAPLPRVVPAPTQGVVIDQGGRAVTEVDGARLAVRSDAWRGEPAFLPSYVTPFHLELENGGRRPLAYDYPDLRLFDDGGFQYTALSPLEVGRMLLLSQGEEPALASASASVAVAGMGRRRSIFWDPFWEPWWWWRPWGGYGFRPPRVDDVLLLALPTGPLHPAARVAGFVYFPRLRPEARHLVFEAHCRVDDTPRLLRVEFRIEAVERG